MSYAVYATGVVAPFDGKPVKRLLIDKKNQDFGEDFPPSSVGGFLKGFVEGEVKNAALGKAKIATSFSGGVTVDLVKGVAAMQYQRLTHQALQILQLIGDGKIHLSTKEKGILTNSMTAETYLMSRRGVSDAFTKIWQQMDKAGLAKTMPYHSLISALSKMPTDKRGKYHIIISYEW